MTAEIVQYKQASQLMPSAHEMQVFQIISRQSASSGFYKNIGGEAQIMMILLAARELGVMPMEALNGGIWNIQGRIEISARLMNKMIRRAGHSLNVKQLDKEKCTIEGKRIDNGDTFSATFTIEDARLAGVANRPVWKSYTEDMLFSRALSRLARRLFADVISTAYVEGEIDLKKLDEAQAEEIKPVLKLNDEQIREFFDSFGDELPLIVDYIKAVSENISLSKENVILEFIQNKEEKMESFEKWKAKKKG